MPPGCHLTGCAWALKGPRPVLGPGPRPLKVPLVLSRASALGAQAKVGCQLAGLGVLAPRLGSPRPRPGLARPTCPKGLYMAWSQAPKSRPGNLWGTGGDKGPRGFSNRPGPSLGPPGSGQGSPEPRGAPKGIPRTLQGSPKGVKNKLRHLIERHYVMNYVITSLITSLRH